MSRFFQTFFKLMEYLLDVLGMSGKYIEAKTAGLLAQAEADFDDTVVEIETRKGLTLEELTEKNQSKIDALKPKFK